MTQKTIYLVLIGLLLITGAASAADPTPSGGGILQAITEWVSNLLFGGGGDDQPAIVQSIVPDETPALNGTEITPAPTLTENQIAENETPALPVLGTVYAVDYRTSPPYGSAPFMVRFTVANATTGEPIHWGFGDGHSSTELDHFHTYDAAGTYTATLTRGNLSANITIQVEPPGVVPLPENEEMMF